MHSPRAVTVIQNVAMTPGARVRGGNPMYHLASLENTLPTQRGPRVPRRPRTSEPSCIPSSVVEHRKSGAVVVPRHTTSQSPVVCLGPAGPRTSAHITTHPRAMSVCISVLTNAAWADGIRLPNTDPQTLPPLNGESTDVPLCESAGNSWALTPVPHVRPQRLAKVVTRKDSLVSKSGVFLQQTRPKFVPALSRVRYRSSLRYSTKRPLHGIASHARPCQPFP